MPPAPERSNPTAFLNLLAGTFAGVVWLCSATFVQADVKLPRVIGDNMVLQAGQPVRLWGSASAGEAITVRFAGREARTTADARGDWRVTIGPFDSSDQPRDLIIEAKNVLTLHNVQVGEVWLCSGQSNMEYAMGSNFSPTSSATQPWQVKADTMHRLASLAKDLQESTDGNLRLFKVPKTARGDETPRGWESCDPHTLSDFSAVGYYFGRKLRQELHVPVGMIEASWGGTRIEPWTPTAAYQKIAAFKADAAKTPFEIDGVAPGKLFESMVRPLAPYTVKGALWYQGESNVLASTGGARYEQKVEALIDGWRDAFGNPQLAFYSVQIAPLYYSKRPDADKHPPTAFCDVREQQALSMRIPHTGLVVTTDLADNLNNIHPGDKVDVGERLARWALATDYGKGGIAVSGPIFLKSETREGKIALSFSHVEGGLKSSDGKPLTGFTVAGEDGQFVQADAKIEGNTVVVSSAAVSHPATVRFAWNESDRPNFFNGAGLPAIPFRTDGPALPQ